MKIGVLLIIFLSLGFGQINWQIEVADSMDSSEGGIGWASLKLDSLNCPRIVYYQAFDLGDTNWVKLIYLYKDGNQWIKETVDSSYGYTLTNYYVWPDLFLDKDDHPHIALVHRYSDNTAKLFYANKVANYWSIQKLDSIPYYYSKPSLALDTSDYPCIAWQYRTTADTIWRIKYIHWDGLSWNSEIIYDGNDLPDFSPSLAIDFENRPHIVYYQKNPDSVKYAFWNGTNWQFWGESTNMGMGNLGPSLKLDSSGYPHFIHGWATYYVHWNGNFWESETTGTGGPLNYLDLDTQNLPHIASIFLQRPAYCYRDSTGWHFCGYIEPDPYTVTGHSLSFCLDDDDNPHVAYIGCGPGNWYRMKYARGTFVGIEENDSKYLVHNPGLKMKVNPSVVQGVLNVEYSIATLGDIEIAIYDVCGRKVRVMKQKKSLPGCYHNVININNFPVGVYFVVLEQNNAQVCKKFLLVR